MRIQAPDLKTVLEVARELGKLARHRDDVRDRARMIGKKLPKLVQGLRLVFKKDKDEHLSIGHYIERNAQLTPTGTALLFENRRFTHRDVHEQSNRWAHMLAARGIGKGDVVAVLLENRPELLLAVAGIVKLGAIAAVINTKQRGKVLEHSFKVSKARTYVVGQELWDSFGEVRGGIDAAAAERVLWVRDEAGQALPGNASDAEKLAAAAPTSTPAALSQVTLGDPCFYIYTSGTTGLPKASIMSHFRWVKAAGVFGGAALALTPADVLYVPLPFYHNNALTVAWASAASTGAALAMRRKFSVSHFWDDVRKYQATAFVYIGELCRYLLNQPPKPDDKQHAVRRICGNGLRPDIWKQLKERFGIDQVYEFYAASEGNIAFVNLLNLDCTVGFCPAKYALIKYDIDRDEPIKDAMGSYIQVGKGEVGLLIAEVNERYAFDGYTDKAASEKKILRNVFKPGDVWFNSGDLLRDQGFRHAQFVDRVGDTFRWKGENVSTNEVAEVINGFADVAESTVYGVPVPGADGKCGMASLVTRVPVDRFDFAGFTAHVRAQLPSYAWPLFLRIQPEIETTGTFKQLKSELRSQGFDVGKVSDPMYVLPPKQPSYQPLTKDLHQAISKRELQLSTHAVGQIVWRELGVTDASVAAAKAFYTELFAWTYIDLPASPGGTYSLIAAGREPMGALHIGAVAGWSVDISVDDLDASAAKAAALGARLVSGPREGANGARLVTLADPQGAVFSLFHGVTGSLPSDSPPALGAFSWDTLFVADLLAATHFYAVAVGWIAGSGPGDGTTVFNAGMMPVADVVVASGAARWTPHVAVGKLDVVRERAVRLGATVMVAEQAVPGMGRVAIVADPSGAAIGLFEAAE